MFGFNTLLSSASGGISEAVPMIVIAVVAILFAFVVLVASRYKKCPSDKIMVIYGQVGTNKDGTQRSAKCIHGGAAFVWPVFQSYEYLDLTPMSIPVDRTNALSHQNIRVDVPSRVTRPQAR